MASMRDICSPPKGWPTSGFGRTKPEEETPGGPDRKRQKKAPKSLDELNNEVSKLRENLEISETKNKSLEEALSKLQCKYDKVKLRAFQLERSAKQNPEVIEIGHKPSLVMARRTICKALDESGNIRLSTALKKPFFCKSGVNDTPAKGVVCIHMACNAQGCRRGGDGCANGSHMLPQGWSWHRYTRAVKRRPGLPIAEYIANAYFEKDAPAMDEDEF